MTIEISQLVSQGEDSVCGQACVAMLTNKRLDDLVMAKPGRTRLKHLESLLESGGIPGVWLQERKFKSLPSSEECWIVAVQRHRNAEKNHPKPPEETAPWWHWILVANENGTCYVLDPAAGTSRGLDRPQIKRKVVGMTTEILTVDDAAGEERYTPLGGNRSLCIRARVTKIVSK